MLIDERYDEILRILDEEQYITAQELAKRLYVSLPTIRRDLAELDQRNLIVRSHGGAKKVHHEHTVAPLNYRKTVNAQEKRALCRAAAELIQDNEIIFIDSSTTTLHHPPKKETPEVKSITSLSASAESVSSPPSLLQYARR